MRKFFLIFLILTFSFSCSDKSKMPQSVLPKQKMQEVMWDMTRAGEFLNGFVLYKDTAMDKAAESQKWYDKIYQLHKITKSDFEKSYAYYQDHPVLMKELLDSLSKKQVPPPQYGQSSSVSKDSLNKKDTSAPDGKRKRLIDTLSRKRILKKKFNTQ